VNVIYDGNTNSVWDDSELLFSYGVTVTIHMDSCANPEISSTTNPSFTFSNLAPGTYCVKAAAPGFFNSGGLPNPTTVTVGPGETKSVLFGFYVIN
jgi:hypothetical protein